MLVAGFRDQPDGMERVESGFGLVVIDWSNHRHTFVQTVPVNSLKANIV